MNGSPSILRFIMILVLASVEHGMAQQQVFDNLIVKKLDQSHGLSQTSNAFFFEDDQNYLWISSTDGLNRFNGNSVITLRPQSGGEGNRFSQIVSSKVYVHGRAGRWFSTNDGLHQIKPDLKTLISWKIKDPESNKYLKEIQLINLDSKGTIWFKADKGLYTANPQDITGTVKIVGAFPANGQRFVLTKKNTPPYFNIISSSFSGTFHLIDLAPNNRIKKIYPIKIGDGNKTIFNIVTEGDSIAWVIGSDGLYKYDLKNFKTINSAPYRPHWDLASNAMFIDLAPYGERYLWVLTYRHGLFLFDKKKESQPFVKHYTGAILDGEKIHFDQLDKIFSGQDGTVWLSNWKKALYYFNPRLIKLNAIVLDQEAQNKDAELLLSSVEIHNNREIYFSAPNHGIFRILKTAGAWKTELLTNSLGTCKKVILLDPTTLLCVSNRSIYAYSIHTKKVKQVYESPENEGNIKDVCVLDLHTLMIRTDNKIFNYDLDLRQVIPHNYPTIQQVNTVFKAGEDLLFFNYLTDSLCVVKTENNTYSILGKIAGVGRINHLIASKQKNNFWVASSQGLIKLIIQGTQIKIKYLSENQPLLQRSLNTVLEASNNDLWLASNAGILKVAIRDSTVRVNQFTEIDGIVDYQFIEAAGAHRGNFLFFGSPKGVHIINTSEINLNFQIPRICLEEIAVNGMPLATDTSFCDLTQYSFSPKQRNISFKFSSSDYLGLQENIFKYRLFKTRLAHRGGEWVDIGSSRVINLAGLTKGHYTLEVIASNSDGIWMSKKNPKSLHFSIQPHWFETNLFYLALLLTFLAITYLIYRNRLARIQDRANLKETELKILRLQMNPHFIYNCLSAIQSYVLKQNVDKANSLITSFAKLMRRVLTESVKSYLFLSEETELLESYLKTESLRFENRIGYSIEIDPQLDPDEILVPSMILQPFVENAIVHGFKKKTEASLIKVIFRPQGAMLACIVEDNGNGLGSSVNSKHHQSKAIEITTRRLELISSKGLNSASLQIVNLADEAPHTSGVRVLILIPLGLKSD